MGGKREKLELELINDREKRKERDDYGPTEKRRWDVTVNRGG